MSEKIGFEGHVTGCEYIGPFYNVILRTATDIWGDIVAAMHGDQRYRVTLEPIEPELKPCPYCGGSDLDIVPGHPGSWCIVCVNKECDAKPVVAGCTRAGVIDAWNKRA